MKFDMTVTYNDGATAQTAATTADLIAFEAAFDRSVVSIFDGQRLTDICWLAWTSLRRHKMTGLDFAEWTETVDSVAVGDGEEPSPLDGTPSISGSPV